MSALANAIVRLAKGKGLRICSVESVTGGRIAASLTSVSSSSEVFYSGIVTYDLESKIRFLDIPKDFFEKHSVYSPECAEKMAENWRKKCDADICVSTTGEAEGTGAVFFGISTSTKTKTAMKIFSGSRNEVQDKAAEYALELVLLELE